MIFRTSRRRVAQAIPVALLVALAACSRDVPVDAAHGAAVPVIVGHAQRKPMAVEVTGVGNVEAIASVAVKARIDGQIVRIGFKDGDNVRRGQILFELDPLPLRAQVKQAEARLAGDLAQFERARDQDRRYQDLLQRQFIAADAYNVIKANLDSARASVGADEAALENARIQLGYASLRSPLDGRAGRVLVQQGNMVKANDTVALAVINQISPIYVNFSVPERHLAQVRAALAAGLSTVDVVGDGGNDPVAQGSGRLSFVDNSVDMTTGTIRLRATLENRDQRFWPGQFVRAVLTLGRQPDAVVVPADAVQVGPKGNYVYLVDVAGKALLRPVMVERTVRREAVISDGLRGGEAVVTDGQSRLAPGVPVEIKAAAPPP